MADFGEAAPMNNINCSLYDKNVPPLPIILLGQFGRVPLNLPH